jgi:hypothetical protein
MLSIEEVQESILKILSYFKVFQYPLTGDEIWKYLSIKCDKEAVSACLPYLEEYKLVYRIEEYYYLENDTRVIDRRKKGNALGKKKLVKAKRIARFLGNFPFVECVCISGSLSKDFALPDGDLDYFIITSPKRLWIARSIMHVFKKLTFPFNAQHSFCMNYYISMGNMNVNPKNFYTAIELATLKTIYVQKGMGELYEHNYDWIKLYLPNYNIANSSKKPIQKKNMMPTLIELLLNKMNGDKIEKSCYEMTRRKWIRKWQKKNYDVEKCLTCMSPYYNTPVNYPINLPEKIMKKYNDIFFETERKYAGQSTF